MRFDDKSRIPVSSFEKVPGALKKSKVSELAKKRAIHVSGFAQACSPEAPEASMTRAY